MKTNSLLNKVLEGERLSLKEGLFLYREADNTELFHVANGIRERKVSSNRVGWIIDRNVNITNICSVACSFCNFRRNIKDEDIYVTTLEEYREKARELQQLGGDQFLLQGGLHPKLGLDFYEKLFSDLKQEFPSLKLHALGPPEIVHIARKEKCSYEEVLSRLIEAGLDSLPGAGAEILSDRLRKKLSKGKCSTVEWLDVMRVAHRLRMITSATMVFGHLETDQERIEHLLHLRNVQDEKPHDAQGFAAFIPWTVQWENTSLYENHKEKLKPTTATEYLRLVAISRLFLDNIDNLQASWLTVGKETAQVALHCGANDLGSVMIEENVVSAAGSHHSLSSKLIKKAIREAGFSPYQRHQDYSPVA